MHVLRRLVARDWRPGQAAGAGLLATLVYSIAMEIDQRLLGNPFNDVRFIQGLLGGRKGIHSRGLYFLSWLLHLFNGVALAEVYAVFVKRFLPGPAWLKGILFGEAFTAAVWSLTPFIDRHHPLIRSGAMPRLATWRSFLQNLLRHLSFGLTLGLLYPDPKESAQHPARPGSNRTRIYSGAEDTLRDTTINQEVIK